MLTRKRQLAAKLEGVEGVAESLSASDAKLLVYDPKVDFGIEIFEQNPVGSTFGKLPGISGKRPGTLSFRILLQGSGINTTSPEWSKLIQACGFSENTLQAISIGSVSDGPFLHGETITGGTSGATGRVIINTADGSSTLYFVILSGSLESGETITGDISGASSLTSSIPSDTGIVWESGNSAVPTITQGVYEDGRRKLLKGCRGKVKFVFKSGEPASLEFEFSGVEAGVTDQSLFSRDFGSLPVPPNMLGANLTLGINSLNIGEMEIGIDNVLSPRDSLSDSKGILSFLITDRNISGSFDPESALVADNDIFGDWFNNIEQELKFSQGSVSGNKFQFYASRCQYDKVEDSDKDGQMTDSTTFRLNASSPDKDDTFCFIQF